MSHIIRILLLCLLPLASSAQTLILTEAQAHKGERSLSITGSFVDADTALVQVYHDGDLVAEEIRLYTWAFELTSFDYYVLKFTDAKKRVKRLYIMELSDDQLEFVPPIEIDFGVVGNLVLLKQRDRKLDFLQFDVGMSRRQP